MLPLKVRENNKDYRLGDKLRTPAHNDNRYYFECIKEGTSSGAAPDFTHAYLPYTGTLRPANGSNVVFGQLVHDMAAATDVYFECTTGGDIGGTTPIWKTMPGDKTADGTALWTARKAADTTYWLTDGSVVWACKLGAGIWMRQRAKVEDCRFFHFTNAGIHVQASGLYPQPTNATGFNIDTCRIVECGVGVAIRGGDSNVGTMFRLDVQESGYLWRVDPDHPRSGDFIPGGGGIWDGSFLGFQQFGNQVAACTGPGYIVGYYDNDLISGQPSFATLVGCYIEADCGPPRAGSGQAIVIGGDYGHPWNGPIVTALGVWGWNNLFTSDLNSPKKANAYLATQGWDTTFASANVDNEPRPFSWVRPTSLQLSAARVGGR